MKSEIKGNSSKFRGVIWPKSTRWKGLSKPLKHNSTNLACDSSRSLVNCAAVYSFKIKKIHNLNIKRSLRLFGIFSLFGMISIKYSFSFCVWMCISFFFIISMYTYALCSFPCLATERSFQFWHRPRMQPLCMLLKTVIKQSKSLEVNS